MYQTQNKHTHAQVERKTTVNSVSTLVYATVSTPTAELQLAKIDRHVFLLRKISPATEWTVHFAYHDRNDFRDASFLQGELSCVFGPMLECDAHMCTYYTYIKMCVHVQREL